ncbi:unnamed protein product [Auanema sp. JU1783]|nr:unnamed protein product [Auanema sp. JU1783]
MFTIFISMYLLLAVPTKLTTFSRFAIHGHDLVAGLSQLVSTLGIQGHIIFPCASGYNTGLFTQLGILDSLNQIWLQTILTLATASFSLLLVLQRAFAVTTKISEKWKNVCLKMFLLTLVLQIILSPIVGLNLTEGGERGRQMCEQKIKHYPEEMNTLHGINMIMTQNIFNILALLYIVLYTLFYVLVATVGGTVLIRHIGEQGKMTQSTHFIANQRRITLGVIYFMILEVIGVGVPVSIREQAKSSQSTQFLANQRRITSGILYFMVLEIVGLGIPYIVISTCFILRVGNPVVSQFAIITMCVYPIFGPYYVLMSNTDYRNRVRGILRKAQELGSRTPTI